MDARVHVELELVDDSGFRKMGVGFRGLVGGHLGRVWAGQRLRGHGQQLEQPALRASDFGLHERMLNLVPKLLGVCSSFPSTVELDESRSKPKQSEGS